MPHEAEGAVHWHEPAGLSAAGLRNFRRPALPYDRFMADEAIGTHRAPSFPALPDITRQPWPRLGAAGTFLQPYGTEGALGLALIEIPAAGATRPEKHLHEEIILVLSGRGTTELWLPGQDRRVSFEWQEGSLFAIPPNALHRMVNATARPCLLLSATTAPALLNLLGDVDAVFANPFVFSSRFDDETGQAFDDIEPDPVQSLALCRTTLLPDAIACDLPLDNRLSPGYRQMAIGMTGPSLTCAIGEHRPGRYAKAHILPPSTIMVGLKGRGFSYLWPETSGPTPWATGHADTVLTIEHAPHALIAAGPGGGRWFHQVFNTGTAPLRHLVLAAPGRPSGPPGEEIQDEISIEREKGGTMIAYSKEDPFLRHHYAQMLATAGITNRMRDDDYQNDA